MLVCRETGHHTLFLFLAAPVLALASDFSFARPIPAGGYRGVLAGATQRISYLGAERTQLFQEANRQARRTHGTAGETAVPPRLTFKPCSSLLKLSAFVF